MAAQFINLEYLEIMTDGDQEMKKTMLEQRDFHGYFNLFPRNIFVGTTFQVFNYFPCYFFQGNYFVTSFP